MPTRSTPGRRAHRRRRTGLTLTVAAVAAASLVGGVLLSTADESVAAPPSTYKVKGVDTSHHNHDATGEPIDWKRVAQSNSFAFLKATQGTGYQDPWFARDFKAASGTSMLRAPYHFFDPESTTDGGAQADHFIRTAKAAGYTGQKAGELPPVLDVEGTWQNGQEVCPKALRAGQLTVFLDRVEAAFKVKPIVYTRASFVNGCMSGKGEVFKDHPLWLARYESGSSEPQDVPGAGAWSLWQYTESESIPGLPGKNGTTGKGDRNVFRGTLDQLRDLAEGGGTPPEQPGTSWPTVEPGQKGVDVTTVQLLLGAHGYATTADGVFGTGTATKVKAFQKAEGLTADGIVGPDTWTRLIVTAKQGSKGDAVKALQRQLAAHGHDITADGVFGTGTATQVKAFQKAEGLTPDGIAGPATWAALVG
ncbi:GH25 family lysozyme [Streptomyces sp. LHD-70]|uniref:peptidoglycan-binding protein n=1 Tax=Streptomyces sp. LHD-70 TaxID=3072140 RepID=UPI0028104EA3|nr:peptidoglycan-binding protein [Streptomyces sp. LHD-70]MDQ8704532.1 GH25 family lysozyme [Streptomyces sp. LHD-70]